MGYVFHCKPFVFEAPVSREKFIGGVMPWVLYTKEAFDELMAAYEKHENDAKIICDEETWEVASKSDPSKKYTVTRSSDGRWTCGCAGFGYRKFCSHIESLGGKR
jgi:hypothetical protein